MQKKIIFVDYLRVIACLSVVIVHWLSVFWTNPGVITSVTGAPPLPHMGQDYYDLITPSLPVFNYGQFGVAVFFLISGMVIPFSLEKKSTSGFIKARLLRIYPTYIFCCLIGLAIAGLSSYFFWGVNNAKPISEVVTSLTLTNTLFHTQAVDWVNWTLSVEIKFYILCVILKSFISKSMVTPIILSSLIAFVFASLTTPLVNYINIGDVTISIDGVRNELTYCIFMSVGIFFNLHIRKRIGFATLVVCTATTFLLFVGSMKSSNMLDQVAYIMPNYFYGMVFFAAAYFMRNLFRENRLITFFSEISYPMYALHSIVGYVVIRITFEMGLSVLGSAAASLATVIVLSSIAYNLVDKKVVAIGKKIS